MDKKIYEIYVTVENNGEESFTVSVDHPEKEGFVFKNIYLPKIINKNPKKYPNTA